ncbi:MAG TPA: hypothetical protein DHN33_02265 [Eubacteriaceae bacterium]|nr:hypothetical protein [Eubacteriaceae bacterium]
MIAVTLAAAFLIFQMTEKLVVIVDENETMEYTFRGDKQVKDALSELEISIDEKDELSHALGTALEDDETITIKRGKEVEVAADGKSYRFVTTENTVENILAELDIEVSEKDIVSPSLDRSIKDSADIKITRVTEEEVTQEHPIKYDEVVKNNNSVDKGIEKVLQKGKDGLRSVTEKVVYHDGEEVKREVIEEKIEKEPVDQIKEVGTNVHVATSRGQTRFTRAITVHATGYCSCSICTGSHDGSRTASGTRPTEGRTIAAASNLSMGTELFIPGLSSGIYRVEDRGGAITGNRIDVYFDSHEEALRFGRRTFKAYVLD